MRHIHNGYTLELIDAPLVRHCIALEREIQAAKSVNVRAALESALTEIDEISLADDGIANQIVVSAGKIARKVKRALDALNRSETMTLSADNAVIVDAARASGWLIGCTKDGQSVLPDKAEDIQPPWLCQWIAKMIMQQYQEAMVIPKN